MIPASIDIVRNELDNADKAIMRREGTAAFYFLALAAIRLLARFVDAYIGSH